MRRRGLAGYLAGSLTLREMIIRAMPVCDTCGTDMRTVASLSEHWFGECVMDKNSAGLRAEGGRASEARSNS